MELGDNLSDKGKADFKLVLRARENGDEKAYAELMDRYRKSVFFMVYKMLNKSDESEDLTIEIFAKAFINIEKYSPDFAFSTWLFRIATNHTIDYIRKKKLHTTSIDETFKNDSGDEIGLQVKDLDMNPHESAVNKQKIELVRLVVQNLPDKYRKLVMLRYFRELAYDEIAEELDIPIGTVKAQLFRAREILFKVMKDKRDKI